MGVQVPVEGNRINRVYELIRFLTLFLLVTASGATAGNEMFLALPTEYVVSGNDSYGDSAYTIKAVLDRSEKEPKLLELSVTIYDASISVPEDLLSQMANPDLGEIRVVNDAGVYGSYFYIYIPFGEIPQCRAARKNKERRSLYVSSLGTMDSGELTAKIIDPCERR